MNKAAVRIGYTEFVLDTQKALTLLELLSEAEIYEEKWHKAEDGGSTYHVYPQDNADGLRQLKIIPHAFYQIAKMAGRPEKT